MSARAFYGGPPRWQTAGLLSAGEETFPREFILSTIVATSSGVLRLTYFTARKSETTTQVRLISGSTAAGATPTLCRVGLYSIAANGDGTLVASTANDTALFAATSTVYTKSWSAPYAKVAGQRYALGTLVVTGAAAPTLSGLAILNAPEALIAPTVSAGITGQTDLPASFTAASLAANGNRAYAAILP